MKKDLICVKDLTKDDIEQLFSLTDKIKKDKGACKDALAGKSIGLIFQKPSNRTRTSFQVGIYQLGGNSIYLGPDDIKLGKREAVKDVAKTLSRYLDGIVARTYEHNYVLDLAQYSTIPVINGLSDLTHPCQALADIYTIRENKGLKNITVAYVGDGNNVLHSLLYACSILGININMATPKGYEPSRTVLKIALAIAKKSGAKVGLGHKPKDVVEGVDIIYTDVWTSMGQEKEAQMRAKIFKGFTVDKKLLSYAEKDCLVMHCLPAHRGEEIADDVIDGKQSIVFDQAENRLHVQKAILVTLVK